MDVIIVADEIGACDIEGIRHFYNYFWKARVGVVCGTSRVLEKVKTCNEVLERASSYPTRITPPQATSLLCSP